MTDRNTTHFHGWHYAADHVTGPVPFLNPTKRLLPLQKTQHPGGDEQVAPQPFTAGGDEDGEAAEPQKQPSSTRVPARATTATPGGIYHIWRSRDNRKGRHTLALTPSAKASAGFSGVHQPRPLRTTTTIGATLRGISRMFLRYPVWDVSYDVATIFTLGSVVWVLNGFLVLLPAVDPAGSWPGESEWGGGVSACVGATVFEAGSVLLMLEAVNENRSDCFGWALEEALGGGHGGVDGDGDEGPLVLLRREEQVTAAARRWTWWPSSKELRTHYLRDIGFLACLSQMIGATIFWISGFTGLPQVLGVLSVPAENGIFWLPQVVGGTGFIVSSWLFMLETQPNWHTPSPKTLGWHIGLWNLIGALGFTLCGALGFASGSSQAYETASLWSTFIGSWAFLVGSIIQWYESLDKYPVAVVDRKAMLGLGSSSSEVLDKTI
ncbi:hypothetical protein INS49_012250 [Diaporthe citri]|uniref:uncharacterized protein n=1 Tax=Diaporthe citri TaxID=83186 RepID=UPI001C7F9AD5|nr:uncharacterized protein INS49_012250 [Diaporthe citri]KAG6358731.1 hypothetical protein INS49_012250 [Diaporthe citri]